MKRHSGKVIFDGRYIQDRYHGIGRYAFHLAGELASLLPDVSFEVLTDPQAHDSRFDCSSLERLPNVRIKQVRAPLFSLREQIVVPRTLHKNRSLLYHTPYFALPWLLPPRARSIITVHDCIFERDRRYMPKRWARIYYGLLMRASIGRSRVVAVPSKATAADVRRFYGTPRSKLVITPEAADPAFWPLDERSKELVKERYRLPENFLLAVGMRRPHKNFATLVRAVNTLDDVTLVFIGDADERFPDDAKAAARNTGGTEAASEKVRFLGKVPEADLPALYNLAGALACPSLVEGFGLPLVEAMASGTPVICSDIPVFREVAGGAAVYVPALEEAAWAAAVARVLRSPDMLGDMRLAGLERARDFSWQAAASALLPAYKKLLSIT